MSLRISGARIAKALANLANWRASANSQGCMHLWGILGLKRKKVGTASDLTYTEEDDFSFIDDQMLFSTPPNSNFPYFDPLYGWRPKDYPHNGVATIRKKTFDPKWKAAHAGKDSAGLETWRLDKDWVATFKMNGLTKAGTVHLCPVNDLIAWLYRKSPHASGTQPKALVDRFRADFNLSASEFAGLFAFDSAEASTSMFENGAPLSESDVLAIVTTTPLGMRVPAAVTGPAPSTNSAAPVDWEELASLEHDLGLPPNVVERAVAALRSGSHLILIGPPGTGKTTLAEIIAESAKGVAGHVTATATSDWTTFETVGGYMPDPGEAGSLRFAPGIVLQAIGDNNWLVVDEINRADADKAFGELFTILSNRSVRLPFENTAGGSRITVTVGVDEASDPDQGKYVVQRDWRMLGTMNTFDKTSLYQLSYAFMRRFAFVEVPVPDPTIYEELLLNATKEAQAILDGEVIKKTGGPIADAFLDFCRVLLAKLFASGGSGLSKAGVAVGPAIPLSVIAYLRARRLGALPPTALDPTLCVLEGLDLFLFPQFEGKRLEHPEIVSAIAEGLGLSPDQRSRLEERLSAWTGYSAKHAEV